MTGWNGSGGPVPLRGGLLLGCLLLSAVAQACSGARAGASLELANRDRLSESWLDSIPARQGRCVPGQLDRGDTLTLAMTRPHPNQLAVVNPWDEWLYLVHDFRPSILAPERFARRDTLRIVASRTRAYVAVAGRDTLENIFVDPGTYRFVLAGRLGTDITQPVYHCRVQYGGG